MSQKDLAEKAGIHQSSLARIERGNSSPSITTLAKLAKAFGKRVEVRFV
jgi:transcriptional regulator with XRE-family HTH domain